MTSYLVAAAALAATLALVMAALSRVQEAPRAPANAAPFTPTTMSPTPSAELGPKVDVRTALSRLSKPGRPFTVAVLSDSTGINRKGWVANVGEWLGQTYDRPVTALPWNVHITPHRYDPTHWTVVRDGANAPITIYNASASSQKAQYSLEHLPEMIPVKSVDLVFISHGHNQKSGTLKDQGTDLIEELLKRYPSAAIINIAQNPEKAVAPHQPVQDSEVESFMNFTRSHGFMTIDVHAAFESTDYESLIDKTLYHPTLEGYRLWSDVVIAVLKTQAPA